MSDSGTVSIYALLDPRDKSIRYVGKTSRTLRLRLQCHISDARTGNNHRCKWLRKLSRLSLKPEIILLEETTADHWQSVERFWIAHFKQAGARLTNSTDGGEEQKGASPELRSRLSVALRGRVGPRKGMTNSPEHRARISAANKGKPNLKKRGMSHTPEAKAKMSATRKGRTPWNKGVPMSSEQRAKLSASLKGKPGRNKGKKFSEQARANMSAAHTGKTLSAEHKAAMSACRIGKPHPTNRRTAQLPLDL